jgi:hypothetical protein
MNGNANKLNNAGKKRDAVIELPKIDKLPKWTFDGSSTGQSEGNFSDLVLNPVKMYPDPLRDLSYLVLCEVLHPDGTPHKTNKRCVAIDSMNGNDMWIGFVHHYHCGHVLIRLHFRHHKWVYWINDFINYCIQFSKATLIRCGIMQTVNHFIQG